MAAVINEDECFAQGWLKGRGYEVEFQPSIVTKGRSPDFLATAISDATPSALWVEVKSLMPEKSRIALGKASNMLQTISVPEGLRGEAFLSVNAKTNEQSVQAVLKMFCKWVSLPKTSSGRIRTRL